MAIEKCNAILLTGKMVQANHKTNAANRRPSAQRRGKPAPQEAESPQEGNCHARHMVGGEPARRQMHGNAILLTGKLAQKNHKTNAANRRPSARRRGKPAPQEPKSPEEGDCHARHMVGGEPARRQMHGKRPD